MADDVPLYVSDETVRKLVDEQFPELAGRELGRRYTIEDQFTMRIGDDFGANFPRLPGHDDLYARAAELIAPVADQWSFPTSHPIATGVPGHGFPYHWSLVQWTSASTAALVPLTAESALPFGAAVREIHSSSPADAPLNPRTGSPLAQLRDNFESLLSRAGDHATPERRELDLDHAREVFEKGAGASDTVELTWTHGRLEPRAVLSDQGVFSGILLWHNFGAGDPAADLGSALNLLACDLQSAFWEGYGEIADAVVARVRASQVLTALRHTQIDNPYLMRMAWERLTELGLAEAD